MTKTQKYILIVVVVGLTIFILTRTQFFKDLMSKLREEGVIPPPNPPILDGILGDSTNPTDYEVGCGGSSYNLNNEISYMNPEANVGACGNCIRNLQILLNTHGANIAEDGMYGANTRQAHQNQLDASNGVWMLEYPEGCAQSYAEVVGYDDTVYTEVMDYDPQ